MKEKKKKNYLANKDMLKEIHKSKLSYCHIIDDLHSQHDIIVENIKEISDKDIILEAKKNKANRISAEAYQVSFNEWTESLTSKASNEPRLISFKIDPDTIDEKSLVFRVMTYDHVPLEPGRKKNPKTTADNHTKCNFPPFKHYSYIDDELMETTRSHWIGGFGNGHFSIDHGNPTNTLARMYIKICEKTARKSNWQAYTYIDEMISSGILQLSMVGLQFNENKSQNPFSYYTSVITNSFTRVLNLEKRNRNIRDDILEQNGKKPSFSRQMDNEWDNRSDT